MITKREAAADMTDPTTADKKIPYQNHDNTLSAALVEDYVQSVRRETSAAERLKILKQYVAYKKIEDPTILAIVNE